MNWKGDNMEGSLTLANGEKYEGQWLGNSHDYTDELIFYTGMVYFQEFITDPAIKGKIVVASYPGIFNCKADINRFESEKIQIGGLVISQQIPNESFDSGHILYYLGKAGVPILANVDTRTIVKKLRTIGEMPAVMSSTKDVSHSHRAEYQQENKHKQTFNESGHKHLVMINFGMNKSLEKYFIRKNYKLTVVPNEITAKEMKTLKPDGIVFSGGPGNPAKHEAYFKEYKEIATSFPTIAFGIGYQVLALSFGGKVGKMKCGHRGFNHPVIHVDTQKVFMTKQNHGYSVIENSLENASLQVSYRNVHDGTMEGFVHEQYDLTAFQFYPDEKNNQLSSTMFQSFFEQLEQTKGATVYA